MEEEIVNVENGPAPKVEKISLAELRAEAQKLAEAENQYAEEQKAFERQLEEKKRKKEEEKARLEKEEEEKAYAAFQEEFDMFMQSINSFTPEQEAEFNAFLDDPLGKNDSKK